MLFNVNLNTMKYFTSILSVIFSYCFLLYAQENKDINNNGDSVYIKFNARTGITTPYPTYEVKHNGCIILEIQDINLFRYSVTLSELQNDVISSTILSEGNTAINIDPLIFNLTDVNLNMQVIPADQKDPKAGELSDILKEKSDVEKKIERKKTEIQKEENSFLLSKGRIDKIKEIDVQILKINSKIANLGSKTTENENQIEELNKQNMNMVEERKALDYLNNIVKDSDIIAEYETKKKDALQSELNILIDELATIEHNYNKKVLEDGSNNSLFRNFNSALEAYLRTLAELNEISDFYQRLIGILYSDQSFDEIKFEKDRLARDFFHIDNISRDDIIKYCYQRLRNIDIKYRKLVQAYSLIQNGTTENKAKEIFDRISAFNAQIKPNIYHNFFLQIAKIFDAINETNFTLRYQSLIISDNADLITIILNAQPHSNLPASVETKPINFKFNVKIKGGLKIDVSTGVFWNFFLNDHSYRFESQANGITLVKKEKNKNLFLPSFGLLFNVYPRSNKDVKFGGNIGFSTNSERLNYYLGGSILCGKSERLNFNIGIAGAQVKTVSDKYDTDTINVPIADLPNEVPMRNPSPFRVGLYLGVSFNLLGTKNKETLSQISKL